MIKVHFVVGTRPEITKCFMVVQKLVLDPGMITELLLTGQQGALVTMTLIDYGVQDHNVNVLWMSKPRDQEHDSAWRQKATERVLDYWKNTQPTIVLCVGDTDSSKLCAILAKKVGLPCVHMEAGIRHPSLDTLEPEEYNRRAISRIADFHLTPTEEQTRNLLEEDVHESSIFECGDLSAASLSRSIQLYRKSSFIEARFAREFVDRNFVLCTFHRRKSLYYIDSLASNFVKTVQTVRERLFVVCTRPDTRWESFYRRIGAEDNVVLLDAQSPVSFYHLLRNADFVVTDSAGVQQEAILLGCPVIVVRDFVEMYQNHSLLHLVPPEFGSLVRVIQEQEVDKSMRHTENDIVRLGDQVANAYRDSILAISREIAG